ncbi:hypothetical protein MLD38_006919 [Melastoma candidum]|nr:hypothetical protein MLD38_006919 [Melastoma candidum]
MQPSDVLSVYTLLGDYLGQFAVAPVFTEEDVSHWLVPRVGVLDSFVIEKISGGRRVITEFFSYTQLVQTSREVFVKKVAQLFYYVHDPTTTLPRLMRDALLTAKYHNCHIFMANEFMANWMFLEELKFQQGHGQVKYSLRVCGIDGELQTSKVGISLPL